MADAPEHSAATSVLFGLPYKRWPKDDLQPGTMCKVVCGSYEGSYGRIDYTLPPIGLFLLLEAYPVSRYFSFDLIAPAWIADGVWRV